MIGVIVSENQNKVRGLGNTKPHKFGERIDVDNLIVVAVENSGSRAPTPLVPVELKLLQMLILQKKIGKAFICSRKARVSKLIGE